MITILQTTQIRLPGMRGLWCAMSFNRGRGTCVRRTMFAEIDAHCYVMVDGDDTYPAEAARALVEEVRKNQADMVVGDRLSSTYFEGKQAPVPQFWQRGSEREHKCTVSQ